jgi:hypothetical protein
MAPEEERKDYVLYDDATLERMRRYFRLKSHDELLRYIKTHGMRRHVDILEEADSP